MRQRKGDYERVNQNIGTLGRCSSTDSDHAADPWLFVVTVGTYRSPPPIDPAVVEDRLINAGVHFVEKKDAPKSTSLNQLTFYAVAVVLEAAKTKQAEVKDA